MSRRRYKLAENRIYHRAFDTEKSYSIKNPGMNDNSFRLNDLAGCESLKRELLEKIKQRKSRIDEIELTYEQHKEQYRKEGRFVPETMEAAPSTFTEWLEATARLDVALEELDFCQEKLDALIAVEQRARDEACLAYGPLGIGKLEAGVLVVIDGQNVAMSEDKVLRISDSRSPYNQMEIAAYKKYVVAPYHLSRSQQHQQKMDDLVQRQRENPGLMLPEPPLGFGAQKIDRTDLPPWPAEVP